MTCGWRDEARRSRKTILLAAGVPVGVKCNARSTRHMDIREDERLSLFRGVAHKGTVIHHKHGELGLFQDYDLLTTQNYLAVNLCVPHRNLSANKSTETPRESTAMYTACHIHRMHFVHEKHADPQDSKLTSTHMTTRLHLYLLHDEQDTE